MAVEKSSNEYGNFLYSDFLNTDKDRVIVFLHDQYDNPDVFNKFAEELKLFHYYAFALPGDELFDYPSAYKNSFNFSCWYVRDLVLSLNAKEVFLIAHGTSAPLALFLANILPKKIKKVSLINPFTSKCSTNTLKWISTLPRNTKDMMKVMEKMFFKDDPIFNRGTDSVEVVKRMKNVYHYFEDTANYLENIIQIKVLEELRLYEENISCPIQLIVGDSNEWIPPHESIYAFNNKHSLLSVLQIPHCKHYPIHDAPQTLIDGIMKFFIKDLGLNDENRLPNKYLYKYLDDQWKQYYRNVFPEKLNARDLEDYNKKMKELEKSEPSIKFKYEEYADYVNEVVQTQTRALNDVYNQVDANYKQNKEYEDYYKQQAKAASVNIDFSTPANLISVNMQGYEVFHDGKGNGFYRIPGSGDWKKVKK